MIFYDNANCGHDRATQFDQTETEKKLFRKATNINIKFKEHEYYKFE